MSSKKKKSSGATSSSSKKKNRTNSEVHTSSSSSSPDILSPPADASERLLFLTVGTTHFDHLIMQLNKDAEALVDWLLAHDFTRVVLQIGTGKVLPEHLAQIAKQRSVSQRKSLTVDWFGLRPDIVKWIRAASLVISHAGAGSIMESLRAHRPLLVVINNTLMHNHQLEVAHALERGKFLYQTEPKHVVQVLEEACWDLPVDAATAAKINKNNKSIASHYQLVQYPPVEGELFPQLLDIQADDLKHTSTLSRIGSILIPLVVATAVTWKFVQFFS